MIKRFVLILTILLVSTSAFGTARHVFLDVDGDGQLQDCPNPSHNSKGTSNTDELTYCTGSDLNTVNGRIICDAPSGCKAWTITTSDCEQAPPGGGVAGSGVSVTNGVSIKFATGITATAVPVYGHPQACVWNMAQSDSCEVHSGRYWQAGAQATRALVDRPSDQTNCQRSECWNASIVAFGNGPNMVAGSGPTSGYGTSISPGYVRGAVMNGSTDTWDTNGNKTPDAVDGITSYPVILDGDSDNSGGVPVGTFCGLTPDSCTGDAFYMAFLGCGHENVNSNVCPSTLASGQHRVYIDANADGTFTAGEELGPGTNWNASFLTIKDIEFKGYNGGPTSCDGFGIRDYIGNITMSGGNTSIPSKGFGVDHVYIHDNAHTTLCAPEAYTAIIGDNENHYSTTADVIENSNIEINNRFLFNDDCGEYGECGASKTFRNNRITMKPISGYQSLMRIKSLDSVMSGAGTKAHRFYNNEIIVQHTTTGTFPTTIFQDECFGLCWYGSPGGTFRNPPGRGQIWLYGNIIRLQGSVTTAWSRAFLQYCQADPTPGDPTGGNAKGWHWFAFNNTWDVELTNSTGTSLVPAPCKDPGQRFVDRNNAYFGVRNLHDNGSGSTIGTSAVRDVRSNDICSQTNASCTVPSPTARTDWWMTSAGGTHTKNTSVTTGVANYVAKTGGPLDGTGSCDPDGDGVAGVDYDGNGVNDTQWTDIAGNLVLCPTIGTAIDIGAVQIPVASICGNGIIEGSEQCDLSALGGHNCVSQGYTSGTLACTGSCTFDTSGCVSVLRSIKRGVIKRGVVIR